MVEEWGAPGWALGSALAGTCLLLLAVALSAVLSARRARGELAALCARVAALEERPTVAATPEDEPEPPPAGFVITSVGAAEPPAPAHRPPAVPAPLFADLVLRESVVQAASWTAGLRRALSPEVRRRIRLEMRREVKRARKQRRADLREARRQWEARQRSALDEGSAA